MSNFIIPEIKYYKYNITEVGTLTKNNGILSGFSASDYTLIPDNFSPSTNTFEFVINFTTGNDVLTGQTILSANDSVAGSVAYNMVDGNLTGLLDSTNTGSWDIAENEVILALSTNTEYTIKLEFTGSSYIYSSLENGSYVVKKTITSSSNVYSGLQLVLGNNRGRNRGFLGTVNLNKCYIKINDTYTWQGIIEGTSSDYDYSIQMKSVPTMYQRKYYKTINFIQPIATANVTTLAEGDMITTASSNYSGEDPYKGFDGNYTGDCWATNATSTGWWQVKFPYKIKITGLKFYQRNGVNNNRTIAARFYTSADKSNPIGDAFYPRQEDYASATISNIPASGIVTDTIYLDVTSGYGACGMKMLDITATRDIISNESDYDYYEDVNIVKKVYIGDEQVYPST